MNDDLGRRRRIDSVRYAIRGIATMLRAEPNARLHAVATALVIAAGLAFGVTRGEWLALTLAIVAVWSAEAINTAFESLCDVASPDHNPDVERAKDVAAAAVLIAAAGAAIIAALIFLPKALVLAG